MQIDVSDYYSIKNASIKLEKGVSVLAGKNGSGKTQLLLAIVSQFPNGHAAVVNEMGYAEPKGHSVSITPRPTKEEIIWRKPTRRVADEARGKDFTQLRQESWRARQSLQGYTYNTDQRFSQLLDRLVVLFTAYSFPNASAATERDWETVTSSFTEVFGKTLDGFYDREKSRGVRFGLKLKSGEVTRFSQLSSGELEFLSLMMDLIEDSDIELVIIDEIDVHYHPDLQSKILKVISPLCRDRYVLVTTHSPALMMATDPGKLFFMERASDDAPSKNQIVRVADDLSLFDRISRMYGGFGSDTRLAKHYEYGAHAQLLRFAHECSLPSQVVPREKAKDSDPQVATVRGLLRSLPTNACITEVGVGYGRLLKAFTSLDRGKLETFSYVAIDTDVEAAREHVEEACREWEIHFRARKIQGAEDDFEPADLMILANVLHEISPLNLAGLLTRVVSRTKPGGEVLILEVLELAVGETSFVVYGIEAIKAMFKRCVDHGYIELNSTSSLAYEGAPLLETVLKVLHPKEAKIEATDVTWALEAVIEQGKTLHAETITSQSNLSPRSLAFRCHNLANALAWAHLLAHGKGLFR